MHGSFHAPCADSLPAELVCVEFVQGCIHQSVTVNWQHHRDYLVLCVSRAVLSVVLGAWSVRFVGWADWVDCRCFLSFVFLSVARRLELSPCNTKPRRASATAPLSRGPFICAEQEQAEAAEPGQKHNQPASEATTSLRRTRQQGKASPKLTWTRVGRCEQSRAGHI